MKACKEDSSFRDNSGCIVYKGEKIYRFIFSSYQNHFDSFLSSGLYESLTSKHWLVNHKEVSDLVEFDLTEYSESLKVYKIIQPEKISFITYPYEWSFYQLKKAALLTLDIQLEALHHSFTLKDASAFNVQFNGVEPIFIDTLSFEKYEEGKPWIAYKQFCQHFLAPLMLAVHGYPELRQLQLTYIDGVPLKLVSSLLPYKTHFSPFAAIHIHYHSKLEGGYSDKTQLRNRKLDLPKSKLISIIEHLKAGITEMSLKKEESTWSDYYQTCSYEKNNFEEKAAFVKSWLQQVQPALSLDAGCNTGFFSLLASRHSERVIAFDSDSRAIHMLCGQLSKNNPGNVIPICLDICNPSPAIGWANKERKSFLERIGKADLVLALALIHHLAIGNNLPFFEIAKLFSQLSKNLIIEFVPKDDVQVSRLLVTKKDVFEQYTLIEFKKQFSKFFELIEQKKLSNSGRILFLMKTIHA
jgi:ribosomal protein L11 methylase PrmA